MTKKISNFYLLYKIKVSHGQLCSQLLPRNNEWKHTLPMENNKKDTKMISLHSIISLESLFTINNIENKKMSTNRKNKKLIIFVSQKFEKWAIAHFFIEKGNATGYWQTDSLVRWKKLLDKNKKNSKMIMRWQWK